MKYTLYFSFVLFLQGVCYAQSRDSLPDKTAFQIAAPWKATYDVPSDVAILYGYDSTFEQCAADYRKHGYNVQFMTGVAWGNYQDYFSGKWTAKATASGMAKTYLIPRQPIPTLLTLRAGKKSN